MNRKIATGCIAALTLLVLSVVAIPCLIEWRKSRNEAAALERVRALVAAQSRTHAARGAYAKDLGSLAAAAGLPAEMSDRIVSGYAIHVVTASADRFVIVAGPQVSGLSGDRYFRADETGKVRYTIEHQVNEGAGDFTAEQDVE